VPKELLTNSDEESHHNKTKQVEKLGITALFSRFSIARNSIIMFINWIVITLAYYGISMSAGSLSDNIFINLILLSLIEIPSYIACIFLMDLTGRKIILVYSMILTGVGCIASGFMAVGPGKTTTALIGKHYKWSNIRSSRKYL
jgi:MFS transporter, OCT family, solute carrier family 22 (organic cation transporter), member 4/5